jgi:hypothetical protein
MQCNIKDSTLMAMLKIVETCDVQQKYLESELCLKIPTDIKANKGTKVLLKIHESETSLSMFLRIIDVYGSTIYNKNSWSLLSFM